MPVLPEIVDEIFGYTDPGWCFALFSTRLCLGTRKRPHKNLSFWKIRNSQWCAYNKEATWNTAVQDAGAMTVGTLTYLKHRLLQIDVTETDESGDWQADHPRFLNGRGEVVKLSRRINALPGDRSVLQTYAISNGKAKKTTTTEKQLSTGKAAGLTEIRVASRPANQDRDKAVSVLRTSLGVQAQRRAVNICRTVIPAQHLNRKFRTGSPVERDNTMTPGSRPRFDLRIAIVRLDYAGAR